MIAWLVGAGAVATILAWAWIVATMRLDGRTIRDWHEQDKRGR